MPAQNPYREILADAVSAPSGDNSQPWYFVLHENAVSIYNIPGRDETLYNFHQRGSYFAHGALIENIVISAQVHGYRADVQLFPGEAECTARITFTHSELADDPLFSVMTERATNRKPYDGKELQPHEKEALVNSVRGDARLSLVEGKESIQNLSNLVSLNERLLMENRALHDFLFGIIRWSEKEEKENPGLYVKTMELPPPVRIVFPLLRSWRFVQILNLFGFSRLMPKDTARLYASSSAFGAIVIRGETREDFVAGGRAFERLWLSATKENMSLQPVTGLPYLAQRIREGGAEKISSEHQNLIQKTDAQFSRLFGLSEGESIAMLFRIGHASSPTARSYKHAPDIRTH